MKKTNLMKILLLSAAFVLASCVAERTPSKTSSSANPTSENVNPTSENVNPTSENVNPTSENVNPTSEDVNPTSEHQDPTSEIVDPTSEDVNPSSEDTSEVSYYVVGNFNGWGSAIGNADYKMEKQNDGLYLLAGLNLEKGTSLKVASSENAWFPDGSGNEYVIPENGKYSVTFSPDGGLEGYHEGYFMAVKTGAYEGDIVETEYFLVGSFNSWSQKDAEFKLEKMDDQKDNKDQYKSNVVTFAANTQLKVMSSKDTWYPGGENNNYIVEADGDYIVYFVPDGGIEEEGWHYGFFYLALQNAQQSSEVITSDITSGDSSDTGDTSSVETLVDYYVVGGFNGWEAAIGNDDYKLAKQESGLYTLEGLNLKAHATLKVASATNWYPDGMGNEYVVTENGKYTVTFDPDGNHEGFHEGYFSLVKTGEYEGDIAEVEYFFVGGHNNWTQKDPNFKLTKMGEQKNGHDQYESAVLTLPQGSPFKIMDSENNWYPGGSDNNYVIQAAGDYKIYFVPDGGITDEGWYYGFFYVALQGGSSSSSDDTSSSEELTSDITSEEVAAANYYLAGNFNGWSPNNEAYKFVKADDQIDGKDVYVITLNLLKDSEFKYVTVVEGQDNVWNPGANVKVNEHGKYTITICPEGGMGEGWAEGKVNVVRIGDYEGEIPETHYYVSGYAGWTAESGTQMTKMDEQKEGKDQYEATLTLAATNIVKIVDSNGHWYPDGSGNEYHITEDGEYTIYFCPEGGITASDWHEGYFCAVLQQQNSSSSDDTSSSEELTSDIISEDTSVTSEEVAAANYYLAGSFNGWSPNNEAYKFVKADDQIDGKDVYVITLNLLKDSEFKYVTVVDGQENVWNPGSNVVINEHGKYTITICPEGGMGEGWAEGKVLVTRIGDYEGEIPQTHYYVIGYAGWNAEDGTQMTKMTEQKEGKDQYEASLHLNANMVIKVLDSNGHYYPSGTDNEYRITEGGDYKVYFCPEGGITAEGWHYGYFYVALQQQDSSSSSEEFTGSSEEITSSGEVTSTIYYVVGSFNEWSANEDYALTKMTEQKDGKDQYESAVLDMPANAELKIYSSDDQWFPAGDGNNATINDAGQYKIYFVPAGGITEEGWINGYFYIARIVNNTTHVLNRATTGVSGTNYTGWTHTADGISYAGQSAGGNDSIQLRSKNDSGIVVTANANGKKAVKIIIEWESHTDAARVLDVYGKDTAYTSTGDLYGSNAGTSIGNIACGTTELVLDGTYQYIGLRSYNNAMYLTSITIVWGN